MGLLAYRGRSENVPEGVGPHVYMENVRKSMGFLSVVSVTQNC